MNIIKLNYEYDYGHDWYIQLINFGKHFPKPLKSISALQFCLSWNEYPIYPYVQITFGQGKLFSILIFIHKFGLNVDVFAYTWSFSIYEN